MLVQDSVRMYILFCIQYSVCACVCGPALHCAGGQNTRDRFDLDSLCLVQSQSCHQLPTAGATHSWCREEPSCMLLLYIHFILHELCSQNGFIYLQKLHNTEGQKDFTVTGRDVTQSQILHI